VVPPVVAAGLAAIALLVAGCVWILQRSIRRNQSEIRSLLEQAEASTRLKSSFVANITQELRKPVHRILRTTELALTTDLDPEQRERLKTVRDSSESLLLVVDQILDFAHISTGSMELHYLAFDLFAKVEECVALLLPKACKKGLEIGFDWDPSLPRAILGDPGRIGQVLLNLLDNAVKFTEQGSVRIRLKRARAPGGRIVYRFTISDTGIGIPSEQVDSVFESFQQADGSLTRRYGGTGLGLAIARSLVERMGGRIRVRSAEGSGSRFSFCLRLYPAPSPAPATAEAEWDGSREGLGASRLIPGSSPSSSSSGS
jgi:signal transduction histidine kinase